jgi:hypothetical protein
MSSDFESRVVQVVQASICKALPGITFPQEVSFAAAGGNSVDALMIVDDIVMGLDLDDYLAADLMTSLMLEPSLDAFSGSVVRLAGRALQFDATGLLPSDG